MSWYGNDYGFRPYVSVAERRRKAEKEAKALAVKGIKLSPIQLEGKAIARTFWGKAWCDNLDAYSDYANRLPRGRSYVRNGSVIDLQIASGKVTALVQGSNLYKIAIEIVPLAKTHWARFKTASAGSVSNLLDLMQGKLPQATLSAICEKNGGLFPAPNEIKAKCSCPDGAYLCKHLAAVFYGIGARLDTQPELFFTLRGVDASELISVTAQDVVGAPAGKPKKNAALGGADLSALFGVEIETDAPPVARSKRAAGKADVKRSKTSTKEAPAKTDTKARKAAPKPAAVTTTAKPKAPSQKKTPAKKPVALAKPHAQKAATLRPKAKR